MTLAVFPGIVSCCGGRPLVGGNAHAVGGPYNYGEPLGDAAVLGICPLLCGPCHLFTVTLLVLIVLGWRLDDHNDEFVTIT